VQLPERHAGDLLEQLDRLGVCEREALEDHAHGSPRPVGRGLAVRLKYSTMRAGMSPGSVNVASFGRSGSDAAARRRGEDAD